VPRCLRSSNEQRTPWGGTADADRVDIFAVSLVVGAGALAIAVLMPSLSSWFATLPEYLPLGAGW
jgi:hypothetical protein